MPEHGELFSVTDRRELIEQGIVLRNLTREIGEIKNIILMDHDKRLGSLEDDRIAAKAQIKSIIWIGGFLMTIMQMMVQVAFYLITKKL